MSVAAGPDLPLQPHIESRILALREQRVMRDTDLAVLYDVQTKALVQAVKRNIERFPKDFMFQLATEEWATLRSQTVTSNTGRGGRRTAPYAFTEQGVAMLSSVLNNQRAIAVNIEIMRIFVRVRALATKRGDLAKRLADPEVDFWCPEQSLDPQAWTAQQKIAARLPQLERLSAVLAVPPGAVRIFIGHGRSDEWLKLHHFLSQTLALPCDEFKLEPTAGMQTASRIDSILASAQMAFLVMTAEDEQADGTKHARQNVVHEIGLFQAALGWRHAIVLLENGCSRFSNLDGLTTINFPQGDIMARTEEIRGVLTRERVLVAK